MGVDSSQPQPEHPDNPADLLRRAVEQHCERLYKHVAVLLATGGTPQKELPDRVWEVLGKAVESALKAVDRFDPARPPLPWLVGFATLAVRQHWRDAGRARRRSPTADSEAILAALPDPQDPEAAGDRIDVREAIRRLSGDQQRALELRYYQGLDGDELARALGAPSPGAARVRVCRALQALRARLALSDEEDRHAKD